MLSEFDKWLLKQRFDLWSHWANELGAEVEPELPSENPFNRGDWSGKVISLDDNDDNDAVDESPVSEDSLYRVLVAGESDPDWEGHSAGIALISDGRWIGWHSFWGPTGSGFCADAYGGTATIYVSNSPEKIRMHGLDSEARMLCGIPYDHEINKE